MPSCKDSEQFKSFSKFLQTTIQAQVQPKIEEIHSFFHKCGSPSICLLRMYYLDYLIILFVSAIRENKFTDDRGYGTFNCFGSDSIGLVKSLFVCYPDILASNLPIVFIEHFGPYSHYESSPYSTYVL